MAGVDLQAVHDTLVSVAFEAGRMILAANPSSISTDTKMNGELPVSLAPSSPIPSSPFPLNPLLYLNPNDSGLTPPQPST